VTAADRPSVTDNARAEAERRWPHGEYRDPLMRGAMREKQRAFVAGAEWAAGRAETTTAHECDSGDFDRTICDCGAMHSYCTICGTRQDDCPHETTAATTEDIADALEHWDRGIDWRLAEQANLTRAAYLRGAEQLMSLLATARTRPTREQVTAAIGDAANSMQVGFGVVSITAAVDAVLALYADQPTEAEAGARALEQAAEWLRSDMDEPWGDRAANRLDVRAARIRAGGA